MYQQVILVGNLGRKPELRNTPTGVPVASFPLAVNRAYTDSDGNRQDKTVWFRVTAWRKLAETIAKHLDKGSLVMVAGEMEAPNAYADSDGQPKAANEVTAQTIRFLTPKSDPQSAAYSREDYERQNGEAIPF